ncbi:YceD family protein [Planococcus dechangensis]|uniref:YceD family protein n=1 Tax=Planococcus dechangensis TaxID=1176255 RepID=A0ABV9M9R4_9BACL
MKIAIQQLQKYRKDGMPIDEFVQLDEVKSRNSDIRAISPVHVTGHCTIGSQQMTCMLHLEGTLTLPCARTWEDVEFPISIDTVEIFNWSEKGQEEGDDEYVHAVTTEVIDLRPILEELIALEVPIQVFKENSEQSVIKGGKDWDYLTDEEVQAEKEQAQSKPDPRLADLAKYFDQTDE